jgi:VanZ family protein
MRTNNYKKITLRIMLLSLIIGVLVESTLPSTINNNTVSHLDKLVHFLAYGLIAYLSAMVLTCNNSNITAYKLMGITLFVSGLGITAEFIQSYTPGRDATVYDIYADVVGACFFLVLFKTQILNRKKTNAKNPIP